MIIVVLLQRHPAFLTGNRYSFTQMTAPGGCR
jgi:hypothetical protein